MEFKGTKGKWFLEYYKTDNELVVRTPNEWICLINQFKDENYNANALLISKAPQIISELKETITDLNILKFQIMDAVKTNHLFEGMAELIEKWIERKKDLIKESTEL